MVDAGLPTLRRHRRLQLVLFEPIEQSLIGLGTVGGGIGTDGYGSDGDVAALIQRNERRQGIADAGEPANGRAISNPRLLGTRCTVARAPAGLPHDAIEE